MKQEQIKEILERIRSNKNNETNELVAKTEEVSLLNATTEATMSVASARALTTTTISADNYLWLEAYDEDGNAFEEPIIGNYEGTMYALVGRVDMAALLAANNISASADLSACSLTLYGDAGNFSWAYSIYDINGNFVTYYYGSGMQVYVPLKEVYDASGDWFFVLEPATGYNCLHFSGAGDLELSYNENPLVGISITTPPIKTAYLAGEKFDPTGMVVTATYSNGETETLTNYGYLRTSLTAGMTSITISYTDGDITKTATQAITVVGLNHITVTTAPNKVNYLAGETFEPAGMVVTATYDNGSSKVVTGYTYSPNGALKTSDSSITISYKTGGVTKTTTQAIMVNHATADFSSEYVTITGFGVNEVEDMITLNGPFIGTGYGYMLVTQVEVDIAAACLSLGSSKDSLTELYLRFRGDLSSLTMCEVADENINHKCTIQKVRDLYQIPLSLFKNSDGSFPNTAIFYLSAPEAGTSEELTGVDITTDPLVVSQINVTTAPTKTSYFEEDKFDKSGMEVMAVYSDGSSRLVTEYNYSPNGGLTLSDTGITISYTEGGATKTTTQAITVSAHVDYYGKNIRGSDYGENPIWNLQTLGMRYLQSGLSIGINSYTIGANLVYDSQMRKKLKDMCIGMPDGWKLDAHQFVVMDGQDDNGVDMYKYIDGHGYVHAFEMYLGSDTDTNPDLEYYDTEGAGLVLTKKSDNSYVIKDKNNNAMHFDTNGRLIKTVSETAPSNTKHYQYDTNGRLIKIYDNRKSTRYVSFEYGNDNLLTAIKTYENNALFETLAISNDGINITSIAKSKNGVSGSKAVSAFTYDNKGKLHLIIDKDTNNAVAVSHVVDPSRDNYFTHRISRGYMDSTNKFMEKTFERITEEKTQKDPKKYCEVPLENEKGLTIARKISSDGNMAEPLEKLDMVRFKTLEKDVGVKLSYPSSTVVYRVNGESGLSLFNSNGTTQVSLNVVGEGTPLEGSRYYNLGFWLKYQSEDFDKLYACITYTSVGREYKIYQPVDVNVLDVWQKITLPIELWNVSGDFTNVKLTFVTFSGENVATQRNVEGYVSSFRMNPRDSSELKIDNKYFKTIKKVATSTKTFYTKAGNYKFTESDFMKTLESYYLKKHGKTNAWEIYYDNGKKRERNSSLTLHFEDGTSCALTSTSVPEWYIEGISADTNTMSRVEYNYTSAYKEINTRMTVLKSSSTTSKKVDYQGRTLSETDIYGVETRYEYFDNGNLKKQTVIGTNGTQLLVYEATEVDETVEKRSFNLGEKYWYENLYGTLDKVEKLCYNGDTATVYNTTSYGYDAYKEKLFSVSAVADDKTHTNTLTYAEGELSTVTDSKVTYGFEENKRVDRVTFGVYENGAFVPLEKVSQDRAANTVTHEYHRNNSITPTDTIKVEDDVYGLSGKEYYNSTEKVQYIYYLTTTSQAMRQVASIVDGYTDTELEYYYDAKGEVEEIRRLNKDGDARLWSAKKASPKEIEYTFSAENQTYKTKTITDAENPASTRADNTKVYEGESEKDILSWAYTYDEFGRLATKINKNGSVLWDGNYAYTYNTDNTLNGMTYQGSYMGSGTYLSMTTDCQYDKGQITKITETTTLSGQATTRVQDYTYDNHGRLKTAQVQNGNVVESNKEYHYDNSGRLSTIDFKTSNDVKHYGYDDRGRLTNCYFENSEDHSYAYSYDNYGNRFEKKAYSNNVVLENYTWTRGRLLERIANASNATIGQYTYDLNGVRYNKTAGGVTTTYFYDGNTLTGENRSDGKRLRYFYDTTGLCGFSYFNGSNTKYYTYVKDVLGNIVMIKDDLGLLMTKYTYDEWGNCTVNNLVGTIGNVNPFRYRGYYFDTESGLYYLMSRYYDPEIGQFISMDTPKYLKPETIGGVDLYAYCNNNPVMYVDPTGYLATITVLAIILVFATIAGGILGGIFAANGDNEANGWDITFGVIKGIALGFAAGAFIMMAVGIIGVLVKYSAVGALKIAQIAALGIALYNIGLAIYGALTGVDVQLIEMGGGQEPPPAWPPTTTGP